MCKIMSLHNTSNAIVQQKKKNKKEKKPKPKSPNNVFGVSRDYEN